MAKRTNTPEPTPTGATFTKPETVAPADRKGKSTVENPVGVSWVALYNMMGELGYLPARKDQHRVLLDLGVAYYTTRTQVQRFRKWVNSGADPSGLPRGVDLGG